MGNVSGFRFEVGKGFVGKGVGEAIVELRGLRIELAAGATSNKPAEAHVAGRLQLGGPGDVT